MVRNMVLNTQLTCAEPFARCVCNVHTQTSKLMLAVFCWADSSSKWDEGHSSWEGRVGASGGRSMPRQRKHRVVLVVVRGLTMTHSYSTHLAMPVLLGHDMLPSCRVPHRV